MFDAEWKKLLEREREANNKWAWSKDPVASDVLEWWAALAAIFAEYSLRLSRHANLNHGPEGRGAPPPPLTMELAHRLCNLTSDLARGIIPGPVRAVSSQGNPKHGQAEIKCIRIAVSYHIACQEGGLVASDGAVISINDREPVKTLQGLFDVKRTTVQGWVKKHPPADFGDVTPRRSMRENDEDTGLSLEARGLMYRVKEAAREYCCISRSPSAISKRDAKNNKTLKRKVRHPSGSPGK